MAVEDERLSDTDINSDSDKSQEEFISLTDVNSDSNGSFIVVDSDNQYMKIVKDINNGLSLPSCKSCTSENNTWPVLTRNKPKLRSKTVKNSTINISSENNTVMSSKRNYFISDGSSDDDLPVMDSLRARLARKRQNAIASPFLPQESCVQSIKDSSQNLYIASGSECRSTSSRILDGLTKDNDCMPNFSDSSGDECEKQPLSSFLISPSHKPVIIPESVDSDGELPPPVVGRTKPYNSKPYERPVDDIDPDVMLNKNGYRENSTENTTDNIIDINKFGTDSLPPQPKVRKKRTAEEIEENKKRAEDKKAERERIKQMKEAEKQKRKIERESKKQFSLGSCLKFVKVLVDTHIMNTPGFGAVLFKACEELGVTCLTEQLVVPYTVMWKREVTECSMSSETQVETIQNEIIENEVLALVPTTDFVLMVFNFKQRQKGIPVDGVTLRSYVNTVKSHLPDKSVTVVAQGIEQYFRDVKNQGKRQHREAVLSTDPNYIPAKNNKQKSGMLRVSRVDIEEAVTDTQLQTGCCTFMPESQEDVADLVRRFSKAVAERPAKKDRFDPIFSFHEEGSAGVKVDRSGHGLLKVWKQQLLQFKNVSPDVAQALIAEYPSPQLLRQAYLTCTTEKEAVKLLENIVVRRGAGVLETTRRIGKELSRRIHTFLTSDDPDLVIK